MTMQIEPASEHDWTAIRDMLDAAGLPTGDLDQDRMSDFTIARVADGSCAGAIASERFGRVALLRSLVVAESARGSGLGTRLVEALERAAAGMGVSELWLLTIDADDYFKARGYAVTDRSEAPAAIRATAEFSSLCPGSAVLMTKRIR